MVGYIAKDQASINGTITIKAYIDKDKILISDTYPEGEVVIDGVTYYNGTPTTDKTVFTTTEWNNLNTNGISFQIKVEAREGTWVEEILSRNDMKSFTSEITGVKSSITEINFIKMTEDEINTHSNLINLTADSGDGVVKAWIENNKLYVASPGETYFPQYSSGLFYGFSAVQVINFNNVNTSNVIGMAALFNGCINLTSIDLSGMGSNSLTTVVSMFSGCSNLTTINMSNFDFGQVTDMSKMFESLVNVEEINLNNAKTNYVTDMSNMFHDCGSLNNLNVIGINTGNVTTMNNMFGGCTNLITLDLSSFDTQNLLPNGTYTMFDLCSNLTTIYVSNLWDVSNQYAGMSIFTGCTSLKGGGTPQTTYDSNHVDKEYARIDGGANSSTPGYLTLKTN